MSLIVFSYAYNSLEISRETVKKEEQDLKIVQVKEFKNEDKLCIRFCVNLIAELVLFKVCKRTYPFQYDDLYFGFSRVRAPQCF